MKHSCVFAGTPGQVWRTRNAGWVLKVFILQCFGMASGRHQSYSETTRRQSTSTDGPNHCTAGVSVEYPCSWVYTVCQAIHIRHRAHPKPFVLKHFGGEKLCRPGFGATLGRPFCCLLYAYYKGLIRSCSATVFPRSAPNTLYFQWFLEQLRRQMVYPRPPVGVFT